jgi:hypothetical protein
VVSDSSPNHDWTGQGSSPASLNYPFPATSTVHHQFTPGALIAPARGAMVLPTRDEDRLPADFTTRHNSDCTLLDINPGIPVFYALGCRKQSGAHLWSPPQT